MFCSKCGNSIPDGALFCGYCGNSLPNSSPSGDVSAAVPSQSSIPYTPAPSASSSSTPAMPTTPTTPAASAAPAVFSASATPATPAVPGEATAVQATNKPIVPKLLRSASLALAIALSGVALFALIQSVGVVTEELSFYPESQAVVFTLASIIPLCLLLLLSILSACILAWKLLNTKTKHQDRAPFTVILLSIALIMYVALFIMGIIITQPGSSDVQFVFYLLSTACADTKLIAIILSLCAIGCLIASTKLTKKDLQ